MACVALATGLPEATSLPSLITVSDERMQRGVPAGHVRYGAYLPWRGAIIVPPSWNPKTDHGIYVLAHEMTHHLQIKAGADTSEEQANAAADACH